MLDKNTLTLGMLDKNTLTRGMLDKNTLTQGMLDKNTLTLGMLDKNTLTRGMLDKNTLTWGMGGFIMLGSQSNAGVCKYGEFTDLGKQGWIVGRYHNIVSHSIVRSPRTWNSRFSLSFCSETTVNGHCFFVDTTSQLITMQ